MKLRKRMKLKTILSLLSISTILYHLKGVWHNPKQRPGNAKATKENIYARLGGFSKDNRPLSRDESKVILQKQERPNEIPLNNLQNQIEVSTATPHNHAEDIKKIFQNEDEVSHKILQKPENGSQPRCPYGHFKLPGMVHCHPWLNCSNLYKHITSTVPLKNGFSYAKKIFLGLWKDHKVVINTIRPSHFKYASVDVIKEFQPSQHIVQLVGSCDYTYITQYHQYGEARSLDAIFLLPNLMPRNNLKTRLQICVSYIEVINFLHTRPEGPRVFCDSPNLKHTLTQFLITDDLHLVLNDLDYLYHANSKENKTTDCHPLGLSKYFNPPESFTKTRSIDERSDLWKIPDVCDYFIGRWNTSVILHELSNIRSRCKEMNPSRRPTSGEVLSTYKHVLFEVMKHA